MIKPGELNILAKRAGLVNTQLEKDYVISWLLSGVVGNPYLKENLVLKGGAVMKKVYFPAFRFPDNLSFTFLGDFDQKILKSVFLEMLKRVQEESGLTLTLKEAPQQDIANYNLFISFIGPLGGTGAGNIKIDIAKKELICNLQEEKGIINSYSDLENKKTALLCYPLRELIAEKMRALMLRTTARDIYDVWYLFEMDGNNIEDHIFDFQEKAKFKKLDPAKLVSVVQEKGTSFATHWRDDLTSQMVLVPDFAETFRKLLKSWKKFQRFIE